tara:strand:+ start:490 stop:879 length:390 start_codon:yes stop_codon:yes gene_type:complete
MALITPTSGDAQPVFATDVRNPVAANASTAATPVNLQGPKLDFFRLVAANTMAAQQGVNQFVSNAIRSIQQTSTVAMYQVDGTALSLGIYPTGAFDDATILVAANIAGVPGTNQFATATGTSVGFKLTT